MHVGEGGIKTHNFNKYSQHAYLVAGATPFLNSNVHSTKKLHFLCSIQNHSNFNRAYKKKTCVQSRQ